MQVIHIFKTKLFVSLIATLVIITALTLGAIIQWGNKICLPLNAPIDGEVSFLNTYACFSGAVVNDDITLLYLDGEDGYALKQLINSTLDPRLAQSENKFFVPNQNSDGKIARAKLFRKYWDAISEKTALFKVNIKNDVKYFYKGKLKNKEFYFHIRLIKGTNGYQLDLSQDDLLGEQVLAFWLLSADKSSVHFFDSVLDVLKLEFFSEKNCWPDEGWCIHYKTKAEVNKKTGYVRAKIIWEDFRKLLLRKSPEDLSSVLEKESQENFLPKVTAGELMKPFVSAVEYLANSSLKAYVNSGSFYILYIEPKESRLTENLNFSADAVLPIFVMDDEHNNSYKVFNLWKVNYLNQVFDAKTVFYNVAP